MKIQIEENGIRISAELPDHARAVDIIGKIALMLHAAGYSPQIIEGAMVEYATIGDDE